MAYVSGTANTLAALQTAIVEACTSNGWTAYGSAGVIGKSGVYFSLAVNGNFIDLFAGTGVNGSNQLTGVPAAVSGYPSNARIGSMTSGLAPFTWPVSYRVFIGTAPDEVVVVVNYSTEYFQWLAFGKSSLTLPGSGAFYSGSIASSQTSASSGIRLMAGTTYSTTVGYRGMPNYGGVLCPAMFYASADDGGTSGESIQHGLVTPTGWESLSSGEIRSSMMRAPLEAIGPNAFNSEPVLLPMQAYTRALGSSTVAMVLDCAHIRIVKLNYLDAAQIITLGEDRWMCFPWYRINRDVPNGSIASGTNHTGCLGFAVRYDGP